MFVLSIFVLCSMVVLLYVVVRNRRRDLSVPPRRRPSPGEDHRAASPKSPFSPGVRGGAGETEGAPPLLSGGYPEATVEMLSSSWVNDLEALVFETVPSDSAKQPLLTLEQVRPEVLDAVRQQINTLGNFDDVRQLQRIVGAPETTMGDLSRLITRNPVLSAKVLHVANSAYYGMQQKLNSISHDLMIIGMTNLKALLYHEGILKALNEKKFRDRPELLTLWEHANYTSIMASYIHYLFGGLNMGALFTLGLLHDIGKFILFRLAPLGVDEPSGGGGYRSDWTIAEEEKVYGINHALVGRLALQHWGLSTMMIEAVTFHHAPATLAPEELGLDPETLRCLLVLFLSDRAARLYGRPPGEDDRRRDRLHPAYHSLVDRERLSRLLRDKALLSQLQEAKAIIGVYT